MLIIIFFKLRNAYFTCIHCLFFLIKKCLILMVFIHCFSAKPKKCISYTCKCIYSGVCVRNIMSIYVLRVALRAVIQFQWEQSK